LRFLNRKQNIAWKPNTAAVFPFNTAIPGNVFHRIAIPLLILVHPIRIQGQMLANPKDIVTLYKYLSPHALIPSFLPLLCVGEFDSHVADDSIKTSMIFLCPFEFDDDGFAGQVLEKGLWIDLCEKSLYDFSIEGKVGHRAISDKGTCRYKRSHC